MKRALLVVAMVATVLLGFDVFKVSAQSLPAGCGSTTSGQIVCAHSPVAGTCVSVTSSPGPYYKDTIANTCGVPLLNHLATPGPATYQCVADTVTAAGASTSVTFLGAAVFATAPVSIAIIDFTDGTQVASSVISSITTSGFTFTSVNTKVYYYQVCGY